MARNINNTAAPCLENTTNVPQVPCTVSVWGTQPTDDSANNIIWAAGYSSVGSTYIVVDFPTSVAGNPARCWQRNGSNGQAITSNAVQTGGAWNHVAAIFTADNSRTCILNGDTAQKGTNSTAVDPATYDYENVGTVRSGAAYSGSIAEGAVAELGVWNVALTEAECVELSKGVCPLDIRPQSLIHYRPLYGNLDPEPCYIDNGAGMDNTSTTKLADHPPIYRPQAQILQFPSAAAVTKTATGAANLSAISAVGAALRTSVVVTAVNGGTTWTDGSTLNITGSGFA